MAEVTSVVEVLKTCVSIASTIKAIVQDASLLRKRCEELSEHINTITEPIDELDKRQENPGTSKAVEIFLSQLHRTLKECETLIIKCSSMGKIKAGITSITQKANYCDKFNRLEKKLDRMILI